MSSADIAISSVAFGDGMLQIQYLETREQNKAVMLSRSIVIDVDHIEPLVDNLVELLEEIVDEGLLLLRNPPKRVRRTRDRYEEEYEDLDLDEASEGSGEREVAGDSSL